MVTSSNHDHALPGPEDIVRVELENGITVLARENYTSPAVVVDGLIPGGAVQEPPEKAGLSSFHASLLMRGTARHTFEELYEEIESIGASMEFDSGGHTYRFGTKSLAEDLPGMLALMAEVIQTPTFPAEHVERVRGQIITGLQMQAHNTRSMASRKFQEIAYPGNHPYARSASLETVPGITRDDIEAFQRNLGPRGAIIVVVGAVKAMDAVQMVRDALGGWRNDGQPGFPQAPPAPRLVEKKQVFTPIPGKSQSDLVLGYPGPARAEPDFQAARMANSILGVFGMYGRLGTAIRQQQGLAYYSYSSLTGGYGPGPWMVIAGIAPHTVDRVVALIREEIVRITGEPVSAEELSNNKALFKGQLVLSLETNEGVAGSIMSMEMYRLGLDYLQKYSGIIDALTADEVQAAAHRYLDPDAFALSVAGPDQDQPAG
jgi:zinc protease